MICPYCNKREVNAAVQVFNGKNLSTRYCCKECATQMIGMIEPNVEGLNRAPFNNADKIQKEVLEKKFCSKCGTSITDVNTNTILGCKECYKLLSKTDNNIENNVKSQLEHRLKLAIIEEDYNKAKSLSDEIKKISCGNSNDDE